MADNTVLNLGSGGDTILTEQCGVETFKTPVTKIRLGTLDVNGGDVTPDNPFPVSSMSLLAQFETLNLAVRELIDAVNSGLVLSPNRPVQVTPSQSPAAPAVTQVVSSASSVTLLPYRFGRLGVAIYNDSTQILYLKLGATAATTSYTVQVLAGGYYEVPPAFLTSRIDGIWVSANGNAYVTEIA